MTASALKKNVLDIVVQCQMNEELKHVIRLAYLVDCVVRYILIKISITFIANKLPEHKRRTAV